MIITSETRPDQRIPSNGGRALSSGGGALRRPVDLDGLHGSNEVRLAFQAKVTALFESLDKISDGYLSKNAPELKDRFLKRTDIRRAEKDLEAFGRLQKVILTKATVTNPSAADWLEQLGGVGIKLSRFVTREDYEQAESEVRHFLALRDTLIELAGKKLLSTEEVKAFLNSPSHEYCDARIDLALLLWVREEQDPNPDWNF